MVPSPKSTTLSPSPSRFLDDPPSADPVLSEHSASSSSSTYPPSPTLSNSFEDSELATRRRGTGMMGMILRSGDASEGDESNSLLPTFTSTPGTGRRKALSKGCFRRPVTGIAILSFSGLLFLVLLGLPASKGEYLNSLPDLLPDRIHDMIDYWGVDSGTADLVYEPSLSPSTANPHLDPSLIDVDPVTPHTFDPNGHFYITPLETFEVPPAPHPILTLIERAQGNWKNKVARQSRSLREAAQEYRRRYTRNPPKGFDEWWKYAKANNIVLVDEYDQINSDLKPFWALEPSDLYHRSMVMEEREETFTIQVKNGRVELHGEQAFLRRAKDLGDLISRFSDHVSDLNLTFTRHDQPACQLGWFHKERMVELAEVGDYFGPSDFVQEGDEALSNWANGCPPSSPLREVENAALFHNATFKSHSPAYLTDQSKTRSYIFNHQAAMDLCQHPEIMPIHGFTTSIGTNPGPLVPLFTFAKTNIHSDILVTPLEQYSADYIGYDPDFTSKKYNKLLWRGSTTGVDFTVDSDWKSSQRSRLHFMTHEKEGKKPILLAEGEEEVHVEEVGMRSMNAAYMDVSFSGEPLQCDFVTCAQMRQLIEFAPTMGLEESYQYKYVIDVDGNGWSGRFHRLMSMKALVLKSTLFPEWYSDRIQPWVHYVPVKIDYTDLYDIMTFFRGTPDGKGAHEDLAAKIGLAGKTWARDHWRKQDMTAYMFRLSLEWSRLLHRGSSEPQDYWD